MENLAQKYRPSDLSDMTEQSVIVDIVDNLCRQPVLTHRNFLFIGPAGTGKAQKLDAPVLTPSGWTTMGQIKIGDEVITHTGVTAKVSGIFPQGKRPIYRIKLEDGASIEVADSHLNIVTWEYEGKTNTGVFTTDKLISTNSQLHYSIPVAPIDKILIELGLEDPYRHSTQRKIKTISYVGEDNCQCIYVDHPDHSYISEDYIMTHNTTLARIIATKLNGSSDNIIEIDAASHSGVEAMREIVSQMRTYPVGSNYRVFIIDECHSISQQGFQVLLKSLEEQPAKSVVALCTTNPEKIPPTILSRVQTFQLSKISLQGIDNRLKYIIDQENKGGRNIVYDDDAILYISKMANGGMRDSITLLEKALSYNEHVTMESLQKALGLPNYDDYFELLNAIAKKDNQKIVEIVNTVYNSGVNFTKWFDGFFSFVTNIVKFIYLQDINQTMIPSIYQDKISKYGTKHSALCLKLSNKLVTLNQELKNSQYLQELAISHLCTPPATNK